MSSNLSIRDVLLIKLPSHQPRGREQEGQRPAIVVGIPPEKLRYPILFVAPLTTQSGKWADENLALYPRLEAGNGGLTQESIVLLDQIRAIDVRRIASYLGYLTPEIYASIETALRQIFSV